MKRKIIKQILYSSCLAGLLSYGLVNSSDQVYAVSKDKTTLDRNKADSQFYMEFGDNDITYSNTSSVDLTDMIAFYKSSLFESIPLDDIQESQLALPFINWQPSDLVSSDDEKFLNSRELLDLKVSQVLESPQKVDDKYDNVILGVVLASISGTLLYGSV